MRHGAIQTGLFGALVLVGIVGCGRARVEQVIPAPASAEVVVDRDGAAPPPSAGSDSAGPSTTSPSSPAAPPVASVVVSAPAVRPKVENIGMHIGGGPNDALTKAPIGGSVAPHFDALRACWTQVADPTKGGDFGLDLLIPAEGGRAAVSHPRTNLHPDAFRDCVVGVFQAIDFARPRTGRTTVSYALRFTPLPATGAAGAQ